MKKFYFITMVSILLKPNANFSQCEIESASCGYFISINIVPLSIIPVLAVPNFCPYGYIYRVQYYYSISVSGINTCYNGYIAIQPEIYCNGQFNGNNIIYVQAPIVGNGITTSVYNGTLTTQSLPYRLLADCNTATPSSLNCNTFKFTVQGPGLSLTSYPCIYSALPIELVSFKANCQNHQVDLEWVTVTELNNDFFTIEKSSDGLGWIEISTIPGAGNSLNKIVYQYSDKDLITETAYYRLKQTDFNGDSKYSEIIDANCINLKTEVVGSPNPSNGLLYFKKKMVKIFQ